MLSHVITSPVLWGIVGLIVGANLGFLVLALLKMTKDAETEASRIQRRLDQATGGGE